MVGFFPKDLFQFPDTLFHGRREADDKVSGDRHREKFLFALYLLFIQIADGLDDDPKLVKRRTAVLKNPAVVMRK